MAALLNLANTPIGFVSTADLTAMESANIEAYSWPVSYLWKSDPKRRK